MKEKKIKEKKVKASKPEKKKTGFKETVKKAENNLHKIVAGAGAAILGGAVAATMFGTALYDNASTAFGHKDEMNKALEDYKNSKEYAIHSVADMDKAQAEAEATGKYQTMIDTANTFGTEPHVENALLESEKGAEYVAHQDAVAEETKEGLYNAGGVVAGLASVASGAYIIKKVSDTKKNREHLSSFHKAEPTASGDGPKPADGLKKVVTPTLTLTAIDPENDSEMNNN